MGKIPIFSRSHPGQYALVSDEDFDFLKQFRWSLARGYARRCIGGGYLWMAPEILLRMGFCIPFGMEIDHINRCPLDNRRENLRITTHSVNNKNRSCFSWKNT